MNKFLLRIITALVIVVSASFGIYYFYQLNNNVSDVYSYYQDIDNNSNTQMILQDFASLALSQDIVDSGNDVVFLQFALIADPYNKIYESIKNTYEYYSVYIAQLNNVKNDDVSIARSLSSEYLSLSQEMESRYNTFKSGMLQEYGELNESIKNGIFNNYMNSFIDVLNKFHEVTQQLKYSVKEYIYGGENHETFVPTVLDIKDQIVYNLLEYDVIVLYEGSTSNISGFQLDNEFALLSSRLNSILEKYENLEVDNADLPSLMAFVTRFYLIEDFQSFIDRLKVSGSSFNQNEEHVKNELFKIQPFFG